MIVSQPVDRVVDDKAWDWKLHAIEEVAKGPTRSLQMCSRMRTALTILACLRGGGYSTCNHGKQSDAKPRILCQGKRTCTPRNRLPTQ